MANKVVRVFALATPWLLGLMVAGCGGQPPARGPVASEGPTTAPVIAPSASAPAPTMPAPPTQGKAAFSDSNQPFEEAALLENPDPEQQMAPELTTHAGKSIPKIFDAITRKGGLWEQIKFVSPAGRKLRYSALLQTSAGEITMELFPDVAPNHVRNFVALARAGYYDGLTFDRLVTEVPLGESGVKLEYIRAGCPKGTDEIGLGHLGYWLKPEVSQQVKHEAGTVGAWHDADENTACCKFYITLGPAPWMDGFFTIFGKITHGLDVARTIHSRPRLEGSEDRPAEPVIIRQVVIQVSENQASPATSVPGVSGR